MATAREQCQVEKDPPSTPGIRFVIFVTSLVFQACGRTVARQRKHRSWKVPNLARAPVSLHFSPHGEAKCMRGPSGRGASCLARAGVLEPYVEHGKQAQRSPGGRIVCFDRRVVRNAGSRVGLRRLHLRHEGNVARGDPDRIGGRLHEVGKQRPISHGVAPGGNGEGNQVEPSTARRPTGLRDP